MACIVPLSTGKRRYGHPALNGVLPQPWLPLKKGQTLANFVDRDEVSEQNGDRGARKYSPSNQEAVVLTLRRRYSVMRKDVRNFAGKLMGGKSSDVARDGAQAPEDTGLVTESTGDEDGETGTVPHPPSNASSNPWKDVGPGPSRSATATRARRLSYDLATGVMNLPDDDGWISAGADDDSDADIHGTSGDGTPGGEGEEGDVVLEENGGRRVARRLSTYWHHPDRKRISRSSTQ